MTESLRCNTHSLLLLEGLDWIAICRYACEIAMCRSFVFGLLKLKQVLYSASAPEPLKLKQCEHSSFVALQCQIHSLELKFRIFSFSNFFALDSCIIDEEEGC